MNRSAWWLVLPIFLGIVGSAIAWAKVRGDDAELAKWAMIIGIATTIAGSLGAAGISSTFTQPFGPAMHPFGSMYQGGTVIYEDEFGYEYSGMGDAFDTLEGANPDNMPNPPLQAEFGSVMTVPGQDEYRHVASLDCGDENQSITVYKVSVEDESFYAEIEDVRSLGSRAEVALEISAEDDDDMMQGGSEIGYKLTYYCNRN